MPHSLRAKLKGLNYKKILTDRELERLCKALDNESVLEQIRAEIAENQKVVIETLSFDKKHEFYNGKWAGLELALAIIDKHTKGDNNVDSV